MRNKLTKVIAGFAALAALALGGAALASAGQGTPNPVTPATTQASAESNGGASAADTDSIQDQNGKDNATEQAGSEQSSGSEQAGSEQSSGSEQTETGSEVAGNDGPGGHADEPGNPNADHQFEGQE